MAWFNFLKAQGYFNPEKNPEPVPFNEGFQIPYWESLTYLEKLSLQIKEGNELELIEEILSIIKDVSEHPKDNYRTWYLFIKILTNLPNEKITKEILNFIPIWMSGRFDTMLQTSELCEKLLPKFLNDKPTQQDVEKAELILHFLFQVEKSKINQSDILEGEGNSYRSRSYLHFLGNSFHEQNLKVKVIKHCSNNFILMLGRTIKKLLLDYPQGINAVIKDGDKEFEVEILIDNENLLISSKLRKSEASAINDSLNNFEYLSENELKEKFVEILKLQGINYKAINDPSDAFQRLNFALNNDLISLYIFNPISTYGDKYRNDEKVLNVYSLLFRDLLDEKAKQNPEDAVTLLNTFCYDPIYRIPFFKRISLYVISNNWIRTKKLFWELIKGNDSQHLFSKFEYQTELFELLNVNQQKLTVDEKVTLQNIIDLGNQEEVNEKDEKEFKYWQLRWYSALKTIDPFRDKYFQLSKEMNIASEHFENIGKIDIRSGSISPITRDGLLQKSNQEIADMLLNFQPKDLWEGPNISGLSDTFGSAVETEPQKFADEIDLYRDVSFIYFYRMLNAFGEAWKKEKSFNWNNVLNFCLSYINDERFYSGLLQNQNDRWGATADWVVGSIANLLTAGMQNDKNAFEIKLLPVAKEIIKILTINLKPVDDFKRTNMDYLTYSYNSTAGKVLRALFDYSLRRARTYFKYEDKEKWENEMKSLFEATLQKGILDGHILEGMYFDQFYFLDKEWITEKVKQHYNIGETEWLAFMSGFAVCRPPFNKDIYELFYPHYEKVIESEIELKGFYNNGLIRHLTAFYFWGYENLTSEKLVFKFLNKAKLNHIEELVNFIWRQENYPKSLTETQRKHFEQIILDLWIFLAAKYQNAESEEEQKILATLSRLVVFVPELNDTYTQLILKSCNYVHKNYSTRELIENLTTLKDKGNPLVAAKAIGQILSSLQFNEYIANFDPKNIIELVSFLFEHGQNQVAIEFCNYMGVNQQFFLRETYEWYTSQKKKK